MRKLQPKMDEGLQQIANWHDWYVRGHRQRLADLNLPQEQHDRELADVLRTGTAVVERMRSDYLQRRR